MCYLNSIEFKYCHVLFDLVNLSRNAMLVFPVLDLFSCFVWLAWLVYSSKLPCHAYYRNVRMHSCIPLFLYCKVFIVHLCDLVDVPEFYEEACDCLDCIPSCCQGKWHINYLLFWLCILVVLFLYMHVRTTRIAMQTLE